MDKELVSVGISFYNSESTISRCIESVLSQSYDYFELILINDGSTDRSNEIVLPYLEDPRIRYISDGLNKGVAFRHNQISELSVGKYIAKLDSDDFMIVDRLKIQYEFMESNNDIDLISSYAFITNQSGQIRSRKLGGRVYKSTYGLLLKNNIVHSTVFARHHFFKENKYDERFFRCQDLELWLRTIPIYKFDLIRKPLVYYCKENNLVKYNQSLLYLRILIDKYRASLNDFQYLYLKFLVHLKRLFSKILYNG